MRPETKERKKREGLLCDRCEKDCTYVSMVPWRAIWLCQDCYWAQGGEV